MAGDHWVHLTSHLAELSKESDEAIEDIKEIPGGSIAKSAAILKLAKDFEDDAKGTEILPGGVRDFAFDNPNLIRGASMLSLVLGIAGDAGTLVSPEDKGAMGTVDRSVAGANGVLLLGSETGALDAIAAADASLTWVPGVGEVVIVGSGVYLAGDWLYNHWTPAHDLMKNDATAVVEMPNTLWSQVKNGILSFAHIPGGF